MEQLVPEEFLWFLFFKDAPEFPENDGKFMHALSDFDHLSRGIPNAGNNVVRG